VLVLDEATASLDHETEEEFLNAVLGLKNQVTIISVAHRATTLRDCDSMYRVREGQLGDLSSKQYMRDEVLQT
jgi:ABC-type bacteriocin/lantibiotic exporter with double-glycine peptidase domain